MQIDYKKFVPIALLLILLLMTVLRAGYSLQIADYPGFNRFIFPDDQDYYHKTAVAIADGYIIGQKGPITRGPGYLYFLGAVYQLFGKTPLAARVIQWGLGIITGLLIFLLTRRLFTDKEALTASLLYALYLPALCYEGALLMASLVTFLLTAAFYCLIRAVYDRSSPCLILSGIFYGWAFICRPNNIFLFMAGLVFLALNRTDRRRMLRFVLPFVSVYGLIVLRNLLAGTGLLSITTQGRLVLLNSHFHQACGVGWWEQDSWYPLLKTYGGSSWRFMLFLLEDISSHGMNWIHLQFSKLYAFFFNYEFSQFVDFYAYREVVPLLRLPYVSLGILSPLAILGLVLLFLKRREKGRLLLALYFITGVFSVIAFYVLSRFRLPLIPLFCVISAFTLWRLPGTFYKLNWTGRTALAAVFICLVIGFNAKSIRMSYQKKFMPIATYNRGIHYKINGQYGPAAADFKRIYSAMDEKTDPDVRYIVSMNLADSLQLMRNAEQAAAIWYELTQKIPDRALPYYKLGLHFAQKGQYNRSLTFLNKAEKLKPENTDLKYDIEMIRHKAAENTDNPQSGSSQGRQSGQTIK